MDRCACDNFRSSNFRIVTESSVNELSDMLEQLGSEKATKGPCQKKSSTNKSLQPFFPVPDWSASRQGQFNYAGPQGNSDATSSSQEIMKVVTGIRELDVSSYNWYWCQLTRPVVSWHVFQPDFNTVIHSHLWYYSSNMLVLFPCLIKYSENDANAILGTQHQYLTTGHHYYSIKYQYRLYGVTVQKLLTSFLLFMSFNHDTHCALHYINTNIYMCCSIKGMLPYTHRILSDSIMLDFGI